MDNEIILIHPTPIESGLIGARVTFTSLTDRTIYGVGKILARNGSGFIVGIPGLARPLFFEPHEIEIIGLAKEV